MSCSSAGELDVIDISLHGNISLREGLPKKVAVLLDFVQITSSPPTP